MEPHHAIARMASPIGLIEISATLSVVIGIRIITGDDALPLHPPPDHALLGNCLNQMSQWFAGDRQNFSLPLQPALTTRGNTLRTAIESVCYGTTISYGRLALAINSSARAIGQACKRNPFPIVIPCHRIISSSGQEFYSAGLGAQTKKWLLHFEQSVAGPIVMDNPDQGELFV